MKTLQQFREEAATLGFTYVREFDNIFLFMDFCHESKLNPENSYTYIKEDGTGVYIAY